jgi:chromosome segregation ATPase
MKMTDIVKELRTDHCKDGYGCNALDVCACDRMADAADEIERLNGRVTELENVANSSESQLHHYAYEAMKAQEEIERLREALQECADSLEAYVEHEYVSTKDHPAMKWRYERDMEDVYRARALLKGEIKYD